MNNFFTTKRGITILRFSLAFVFLWFGFSQFSDINMWVSFVPDWVVNFTGISAGMFVLFNSIFEIIFGILLALGIFTRFVSIILGLHLLFIGLSLGLSSAVGVRDIGLGLASIALGFFGGGELALTSGNNLQN